MESSGGNFKVFVDKDLIFDKLTLSKKEKIFPKDGELTDIIKERYNL